MAHLTKYSKLGLRGGGLLLRQATAKITVHSVGSFFFSFKTERRFFGFEGKPRKTDFRLRRNGKSIFNLETRTKQKKRKK